MILLPYKEAIRQLGLSRSGFEPLKKLSNSSWKKAKVRSELPIRFHDLRHTFGHRLRAVGAPVEDRKALLGHTNGEITTHYSAAELGTLLKWAEAIVDGPAPR